MPVTYTYFCFASRMFTTSQWVFCCYWRWRWENSDEWKIRVVYSRDSRDRTNEWAFVTGDIWVLKLKMRLEVVDYMPILFSPKKFICFCNFGSFISYVFSQFLEKSLRKNLEKLQKKKNKLTNFLCVKCLCMWLRFLSFFTVFTILILSTIHATMDNEKVNVI